MAYSFDWIDSLRLASSGYVRSDGDVVLSVPVVLTVSELGEVRRRLFSDPGNEVVYRSEIVTVLQSEDGVFNWLFGPSPYASDVALVHGVEEEEALDFPVDESDGLFERLWKREMRFLAITAVSVYAGAA